MPLLLALGNAVSGSRGISRLLGGQIELSQGSGGREEQQGGDEKSHGRGANGVAAGSGWGAVALYPPSPGRIREQGESVSTPRIAAPESGPRAG